MARMHRALSIAGLAGMLAAGCGGSHLYSKQDHELAKQAQEAFDKADLSASLDEEYALLGEMLDHELAIVRRHTLARRDATLIAIIGGTDAASSWQHLESRIAGRARDILGGAPQFLEMRKALALLPIYERDLRGHQTDYELLKEPKDPRLACPPSGAVDKSKISAGARPSYEQHERSCNQYQTTLAALRRSVTPDSVLGSINTQLAAIEELERGVAKQVAEIQGAHQALEKEIARARAARTDAAKKLDVAGKLKEMKKKLDQTLEPMDKHLATARKTAESLGLEDLDLVTEIARLEEQRAAVDALVEYLISGEGEAPEEISPEVQLRLELARQVPAIAAELASARRFPRVGALVLESEHLRLRIQALKQRRERAGKRRALLGDRRDALLAELRYLGEAQNALDGIDAGAKRLALFDAYRQRESIRGEVADALLSYANAWTVGRLAQEEIDYKLIGLAHESALDGTAAALAQWENLIRVPLAQLVALHSAGVTSEDISRIVGHIITAAGLTAVGIGVNR